MSLKKKTWILFWPFQSDLISSALVVKYLNDSARRIVWYDLDKREACLICRLEPLCCLCFRVFVCFAGIGTDMTQVGRLPLEVKKNVSSMANSTSWKNCSVTSILMARTWVSSKNESLNQLVQHNKPNHLKVLSNFFLSGGTWALRPLYKLCNLQLEPHRTT